MLMNVKMATMIVNTSARIPKDHLPVNANLATQKLQIKSVALVSKINSKVSWLEL